MRVEDVVRLLPRGVFWLIRPCQVVDSAVWYECLLLCVRGTDTDSSPPRMWVDAWVA